MSTFKTIGVISRPRRVDVSGIVPPLMQWLAARNIQAHYDQETATSLKEAASGKTRGQLAAESDLLLVLGGDGTLLWAAREAAPRFIPLAKKRAPAGSLRVTASCSTPLSYVTAKLSTISSSSTKSSSTRARLR